MSDFTTAQQARIRMVLGYPSLNRYKNPRLEGIIAGTNVLDSDTIALIVTAGPPPGLLANLATVDDALLNRGLPTVGVAGVSSIKLFEGKTIKEIKEIGRTYITQLSTMLGVPIYADYFGQRGYPGDSYSAEGLGRAPSGSSGGGGGGMIPLG